MADHLLLQALIRVRRRLLGVTLSSGVAWGLAAGTVVLVACAWIDLALDLPPAVRLACSLGAVACGAALVIGAALGALRETDRGALARRLDRAAGSEGQILSGVDLSHQYGTGSIAVAGGPMALTTAMARMAVDRAANLASNVRAAAAVPIKPLYGPLTALGVIGCGLAILALAAPRLAATEWARFSAPFGDHPPYSAIQFDIKPGDTKVLYGGSLDVRATTRGGLVEQLDLVLLSGGATSAAGGEVLPMFPEPDGAWRATVTEVTAAGRYFVRARGARSGKFTYDVITVPELRDVRFRVTPPAYTRRPAYEGPLPQGGLAGLPGTKVELWARSNRPLSGGSIHFTSAEPRTAAPTTGPASRPAVAARPPMPSTVALSPTGAGAAEVTGSFAIAQPGKLELKVVDVAGQSSQDTFSASVSLLNDDRPFVRLLEPKPNSYATPDVTLNVALLAEDDYGISRVQLFRSLNDSRPLPVDVAVPSTPPTRLPAGIPLPLADYGLKPGDVIRLFARVEDNDPAGAKGSESAIVTVQIVSREDLNRMTLAREGMEVLQNKYEQARRRMEALDNEIQKLQKELAETKPDAEVAKAFQDKLEALAQKVMEEGQAIADNAAEDLPFDLDRSFRRQVYDLAAEVKAAGRKFDHDAGQLGLSAAGAGKALSELQEKLGTKKKEFEENATDPIEHLAKIFPLKEDEARFTDLYQRQLDLAGRMQALKNAGGDDPKAKSRMRDLEAEQRQLREELRDLLDDIDSHVAALPADPRLDGLRKQGGDFAKAVRESAAGDQMRASETALSEFKGGESAKKAQDAADTLAKFVGKCNGMGGEAGMCLSFSPKLSEGLGNTVEQLLAAEGLMPGGAKRSGTGAGGGYSQKRSTLNNVGLYGSLPRLSEKQAKSGGRSTPGAVTHGPGQPGDAGDPAGLGAGGRIQGSGEAGTYVPARYRRKVGEYFQRVADELGE